MLDWLPMTETKNSDTKSSFNTLLVVLLVIASFLIGSLWTRVQYLEKNPAVSNASLQTPPKAVVSSQPTPTTESAANIPKITKDDHIRGNKNATLAIIEYSDLECPFCKQFHPTMQKVVDTYKDKVMWVFRHFPLSFHANAQKEAEAAECAGELSGNDAFWKYVDKIFERTTSNGTGFALDKLVPLAKELGLEETKFKTCLDSGKYTKHVQEEMTAGQNAGISGTPGNILLNTKTGKTQLVPGAVPFEQIKSVIDQML